MDLRNPVLSDALRPVPKFVVGGWVRVYNAATNISHGVQTNTSAKVLKAKLLLNWTGPYKSLAVRPSSSTDTPDCPPLSARPPYLGLPSDMVGAGARRRVSVQCCMPYANPHDRGNRLKYLPAGSRKYVLKNF